MFTISPTDLLACLQWRYATKQFDATKIISAETWSALEDALVLSPSSYGLQPWQFFVITDPAVKSALRPHSWNQAQVTDCSHHVVFAIRDAVDMPLVDQLITRTAEVRSTPVESLAFYRDMISSDIINGPRSQQSAHWAGLQTYIALGNFMTCAALLGVDTCPMEGFDPLKYDEILGLPEKGFRALVACSAGYRSATDKYATSRKVRFDKSHIIQHI